MAKSKGDLPIVEFTNQKAWESWLERNHQRQDGVWMKLARKAAAVKTQTHAEALEAALCYGWIDGQAARYDDHYMVMRFTPRRRLRLAQWRRQADSLTTELFSGCFSAVSISRLRHCTKS